MYFNVKPRSSRIRRIRSPNNWARNECRNVSRFVGTTHLLLRAAPDNRLPRSLFDVEGAGAGGGKHRGDRGPYALAHRFDTRPGTRFHDPADTGTPAQSGHVRRRRLTGDSPARTTPRALDSRQPRPSQERHWLETLGSVMPPTISWQPAANHYSD
ncbi:hypothetical protein ACTMTJ_29035 [Phytohabitans sp. LJ34]|uniref:hypothetical protein n=1 Tax=Phytohabitans sp. LJ34 TaxID=3452217 RepID=UPI003F8CD3A9